MAVAQLDARLARQPLGRVDCVIRKARAHACDCRNVCRLHVTVATSNCNCLLDLDLAKCVHGHGVGVARVRAVAYGAVCTSRCAPCTQWPAGVLRLAWC